MGLDNHIGGVLFRIEAAIIQGLTHLNCPSILAQKNIPKFKTNAEAVEWKESVFTKPDYKKLEMYDHGKLYRAKKDFLAFSTISKSQKE